MSINRREWLGGAGATLLAAKTARPSSAKQSGLRETPPGKTPLDLSQFQPKGMLRVPETQVARARYPVIDVHTHLSRSAASKNGVFLSEKMQYVAPPEELLNIMDRRNLRLMVSVTGGFGRGLEETVRKYPAAHPERFLVFTEPWWSRSNEPGYARFQAEQIEKAHGVATPQQIFGDELYEIYFRFLETEDEYFDYAPALIPPQGRWRIYGLGLPDAILRKVYYQNAERLLGLRT
jgi:hypothetical protein